MKLTKLFFSFFKIALLTLGGGAVMLPIMEDEFVRRKRWLEPAEMVSILTLTQTLPGVLAFKSSLLIGYRVAGLIGAAVSLLGVMIPSILIIALLAGFIERIKDYPAVGRAFSVVRSGVCALTLVALIRLARQGLARPPAYVIAALAFGVVVFLSINPVAVILLAALPGFIFLKR